MKLKKLLLITCLISPLSAWAGGSAFINPVIILKQAPQAVKASIAMEAEFKGRDQALRKMLDDVKKLEENFNKNSSIMSEVKRKKAEEDIIAKQREFRFVQQSLKEDVLSRRKEAIAELKKTISGVIQAYGKKKGYDFIFTEGVAYTDESLDITQEILNELKKISK